MFFLPIFVMISLSLFGSVYAQIQTAPTLEEIDRLNLATQQQSKYTQKLTDIFQMCGTYAVTIYHPCTNFLEVLNEKTAEAFNETKADIDKILYG